MSPRRTGSLLLTLALLAAGCGNGDTPVTAQSPAAEQTATTAPAPTPAPTTTTAPDGSTEPSGAPAPAGEDPSCSGADIATTQEVPTGVPEEVATTLLAIRSAAQSCDFDRLAELALADGTFSATFGPAPADQAELAELWRSREADDDITAVLVRLTTIPRASVGTTGPDGAPQVIHVAPRASIQTDATARQQVIDAFGRHAEQWFVGEDYLGWRLGIAQDGSWRYFVAGD